MIEVVCDFETASAVNLKLVGHDRYAADPTTEILSLVYRLSGGRNTLWTPEVYGSELRALAAEPTVMFVSHANFEQSIWREIMVKVHGFPPLPAERWHDTQAAAAYRGLPLDLDRLARVLGVPATKDLVGRRVTLGLSNFNKKTGMLPERTTEAMERVYAYNAIDVDLTAPIHRRLGPLPSAERAVWLLDQHINQRGVGIDLPFVRACRRVVERAAVPLVQEFAVLTSGLSPTQTAKLGEWCARNGVDVPNMRKETLAALLGETEEDDNENEIGQLQLDTLPGNVRRALTIRSLVGSASIKKLAKMEASVCADGRARGLLQYHGAGPGRWSGRGFQPQNFPRGTIKHDIDEAVAAIMRVDLDDIQERYGSPIELVVSCLRHAVVAAPGRLFGTGDFAGIEARLVLAVAGQHDKTALMASGVDVYCDMATTIHGRPIIPNLDKQPPERQDGKQTVLGAGYGMGPDTFCKRYIPGCACKNQPGKCCNREIEAFSLASRGIAAYRDEWAPLVKPLWAGLELAALKAVYDGRPYEAYGIEFRKEEGFLSARLLDGKKIWYFDPQRVRRKMPWTTPAGEEVWRDGWTFKTQKLGRWVEVDAYGGLLTQNLVGEGLGRQLLVAAMHRLEKEGLPVVMTVHDEVMTEPQWNRDPAEFKALVKEIMAYTDDVPWVKQIKLPVDVEPWAGRRYRK